MNLMQRVQDILLRPKTTWPVIADEPGDVAGIYAGYLVYLAAIPAESLHKFFEGIKVARHGQLTFQKLVLLNRTCVVRQN